MKEVEKNILMKLELFSKSQITEKISCTMVANPILNAVLKPDNKILNHMLKKSENQTNTACTVWCTVPVDTPGWDGEQAG